MKQLKREKDKIFLFDLDKSRRVEKEISRAGDVLCKIAPFMKENGLPVDEETLKGVFSEGFAFIKRRDDESISDWAKGSPLAKESVERLKAEKAASYSNEMKDGLYSLFAEYRRCFSEFPPVTEELSFSKGKISIKDSYRERILSLLETPVSEEDLRTASTVRDLIEALRKLESKYYVDRIETVSLVNEQPQIVFFPGLIAALIGTEENRPELTDEFILNEMNDKTRRAFDYVGQ